MTMSDTELPTCSTRTKNTAIRRGLWVVGVIVATGIGIAGFSIASGLLLA
jgi:hypothetical protein